MMRKSSQDFHPSSSQKSIVALGSGQGSTIEFFCQQIQEKNYPFYIKSIITDNPKSRLLQIAQHFKIPCHVLEFDKENPSLWDKNLVQLLNSYKPSLIVLAGFLKKIGTQVIKQFPKKIINSHPSLLPEFGGYGFYGLKVHQAVVSAKKKETGLSIHWVNSEYDKGELVNQLVIPVKEKETAEELQERIKKKEKLFYFQTIANLLNKKA